MEYFDIRTPDGKVTGKIKERSLVHRDGDLHGTSQIGRASCRERVLRAVEMGVVGV